GVAVVVRAPVGGGTGAGPYHSQNVEAWFTHVAGLKVVAPATPHDAKGLLIASFEDGNPVLYLEHKLLYRSARGRVPAGWYTLPLGRARGAGRHGRDDRDLVGRRGVGAGRGGAPGRGRPLRRGHRPAHAAAVGPRKRARLRAQDEPRAGPARGSGDGRVRGRGGGGRLAR